MCSDSNNSSESILGYFQNGLEQENSRTESLDSKSQFMISTSGLLTGISFTLITLAYKDLLYLFQNVTYLKIIVGIILVISELFFVISTICSIISLAIKKFYANIVYLPEDIDQWINLKYTDLNIFLAKKMQLMWLHNRSENDTKVKWIKASIFCLTAGSVALSIGILTVLGYFLIWNNI